ARRVVLPDAVSEMPGCDAVWYVGCQDGHLYQFSGDGTQLWDRQIAADPQRGNTALVAPFLAATGQTFLRIAASQQQVIVTQADRCYALNRYGNEQWMARIPGKHPHHVAVPPPVEIPTRASLLQKLGIHRPVNSMQTGYLRMALAGSEDEISRRLRWMTQV